MKILSIVVPCYNSQDYMRKCVDSLLKGGDGVEIILIDDGSTDKTGAIADGYADLYPDIVKVVHQENGGHGEGINSGLKVATGRFFKVVDSDDYLSGDLVGFLPVLKTAAYDADLVVSDYVYTYTDPTKNNRIGYGNIFKPYTVLSWEDTNAFNPKQYLTIHSCVFNTEVIRKSGMVLPKKLFYEDNLMVCTVLPFTRSIFYCDIGLYHYCIGREGQSVQEDVMTKRYSHQLTIAAMIFETCKLDEVKKISKRLYKLMYHEMFLMFGIACVFARKSKDPSAYENLEKMWERAYKFDKKYAERFRKRSALKLVSMRGDTGKWIATALYSVAHKIVKFN